MTLAVDQLLINNTKLASHLQSHVFQIFQSLNDKHQTKHAITTVFQKQLPKTSPPEVPYCKFDRSTLRHLQVQKVISIREEALSLRPNDSIFIHCQVIMLFDARFVSFKLYL